jgi:hypothetical protein
MPSGNSSSRTSNARVAFHEEQVLQPASRRWLLALLPATVTALAAGQLRLGHPLSPRLPSTAALMSMAVLLWGVYVWLSRVRLVTDVDPTGVSIRMRGLSRHHRIPLDKVAAASIVTFDTARDFGGYGIRSVKGGRAFVGTTTRGVRLELPGGTFAVIGSRLPEQLLAALQTGHKG